MTPENTQFPAVQHLGEDLSHADELTMAELVADLTPVVHETKAGWKTTEFWAAAIGVLLTQLGALHLPGKYGETVTTVAIVAAYILSRGFAKAGVPNVQPAAAVIAPEGEIVQRDVSPS